MEEAERAALEMKKKEEMVFDTTFRQVACFVCSCAQYNFDLPEPMRSAPIKYFSDFTFFQDCDQHTQDIVMASQLLSANLKLPLPC